MSAIQSFILGIIQGLSEFLPISSSAHLVIFPYFAGWELNPEQAFIFDVLVQLGTLVAVIVYFRTDLVMIINGFFQGLKEKDFTSDPSSRLAWNLILASIPAGILGLLLKSLVEKSFTSIVFTGIALIFNSIFLLIAELVGKKEKPINRMNWKDAIWIGFFQVAAIFPGISRSGSTIMGGMTRNFDRASAARFAFLMSVPIMLAAGMLALYDLASSQIPRSEILVFIPGFLSSAIVGYFAIRWLLIFLQNRPLYIFSAYCFLLGSLVLVLYFT